MITLRETLQSAQTDDPKPFNHRFADVNGIRVDFVDEGTGALMMLVHGFPYLWYAWRSQIRALAAAGYRVVAPDLRGYGQTGRPDGVELYDHTYLVGDMVCLMQVLGETSAVIVGHDVGAGIVNAAALMRPDLFRAVGPSFLAGATIRQPGISIMGADDPVFPAVRVAYEKLGMHMTDLRKKVMLPGVGHAAAEEKPLLVNDLLIEFLRGL